MAYLSKSIDNDSNESVLDFHRLGRDRLTNKIVPIVDAERGLACNCICDKCLKPLIAAKGDSNEWHFRHYEKSNCNGGQETALHKLAKQLLCEGSILELKNYGKIFYNDAQSEIPFREIVPDVTAKINGENFFVEIYVTHAIGTDKESFYKNGYHKSIEINLRNYIFISVDKLRDDIFNSENCRVIFWERTKEVYMEREKTNWFGFLF